MEEAGNAEAGESWWRVADVSAAGASGVAELLWVGDQVARVALFGGPTLLDEPDPCQGKGRNGEGGGESCGGKNLLGDEGYRIHP